MRRRRAAFPNEGGVDTFEHFHLPGGMQEITRFGHPIVGVLSDARLVVLIVSRCHRPQSNQSGAIAVHEKTIIRGCVSQLLGIAKTIFRHSSLTSSGSFEPRTWRVLGL
jgi:hypothetical protein